jgi:hypothetical protein
MLLYIHKIEYCEAKHLKSAIFLPNHFKVILKEVMPWREVPIVGLAALETGDELDNGVRLHTQKLTATLETEYVFPQSPIAFLITAVNGMQYLIGTPDAPFPSVQQNSFISSAVNNVCNIELHINLSSSIPQLSLNK